MGNLLGHSPRWKSRSSYSTTLSAYRIILQTEIQQRAPCFFYDDPSETHPVNRHQYISYGSTLPSGGKQNLLFVIYHGVDNTPNDD